MSKSGKVFVFPSSEGGRPPIGTEGEVRLVYCGRRATRPLGPGSKVYHQYIYLEDVDEALKMSDDYPMSFSNPLGSSKRSLDIPGGIYRGVVKCEEDEDGYVGTIVYGVGSWEYCGVIESDRGPTPHGEHVEQGAQEAEGRQEGRLASRVPGARSAGVREPAQLDGPN